MSLATVSINHLDPDVQLAQERGEKKREWASSLHDCSLAVVGSMAGIEAPICSNDLSIK